MKQFGRAWLCLALACASFAAVAPGFRVVNKYAVPGDGGFDYIVFDGSANRLYVSHGTEVNVLDAGSGKVLGKVADTPGVHGIAIVPSAHLGFTTNGGEATVSVFDTNNFQTIKKIHVPEDPDFALYDSKGGKVLVCHGDGAAITVIDPEKQIVVGKISLGGGAEAAVTDGTGNGFVNLEESATLVKFDLAGMKVTQKWPISGCKTPTGLAMDAENSRLFIGCRSRVLAVMDSGNGKVITTLPIGDGVDAVAFDAEDKLIFASNRDGTVSVIRQRSADTYEPVGEIQTQKSAKTMAFDPQSKRLFLSAAEMEPSSVPKGRPKPKPGSFNVLVVEPQ
jgi:DNA-binding beta-propeller fold protein YncE